MSTDSCKKEIIDWLDSYYSEEVSTSDLKRIKKIGKNPTYRIFENKTNKNQIITITYNDDDPEDLMVMDGGPLVYMMQETEDGLNIMFTTKQYYEASGNYHWDQHWGSLLELVYNIPSWIVEDEVCENNFIIEDVSKKGDIIEILNSLGLEEVEER